MNEKNQLGLNSCFLNLDDPIKLFEIWMEKAKQTEPNDPNAVALATSNKNNVPSVRMVLLKDFNKDGFITTEITPEVSSIYDFIGPDQNIPWVKKRVSNTTIRVQNDESIIIAGLLGTDKRYETNRVPFLWKLPYLGKRFFTTTSEIERKTDLIIQITPKIVEDTYSGIVKSESHLKAEDSIDEPDNSNDTKKD